MRVRPRTMPCIGVPPIFFVTDQQMPTGMPVWKTASPMSHRKLSRPAQNWLVWTRVWVPSPKT